MGENDNLEVPKKYREIYEDSINNPESFWGEIAETLVWTQKWEKVLISRDSHYEWFKGGTINTCYNAVDRHVNEGRGEQVALYYDSPVTNTKKKLTYSELQHRVAKVAGMLIEDKVEKGDRVIIYMPMILEAVIGMLACARLGAIHSVVFGGFSSNELAKRINDSKSKVILTASCGIEVNKVIDYKKIVDEAISQCEIKPQSCFVFQRKEMICELGSIDLDWEKSEAQASPTSCREVGALDPIYILYTSGTTGTPKGVIRPNGGHAVAIKWSMKNIYNINPGDVYWAASDIGWIVGHSYMVYGPLLQGCSTVIYEGKPVKTPDSGAFWRVCEEYKVNCLFSAPTAFRAIKREDSEALEVKKYDLSALKSIFIAGERCDSDTLIWLEKNVGKICIDHWWQTETGWAVVANPLGIETLPIKPGSSTKPMPGFVICILNEAGEEQAPNKLGNIVIKLPLPPSCLMGVWGSQKRFQESYLSSYPGYYLTGDSGYIDEDGYVWIMGRVDGVINVAGHRLSTGEIEEIIATHKDVAECSVIGVNDELKGEVPVGFIILKGNISQNKEKVVEDIINWVREKLGAVISFKIATVVARLPKTRSGKILRGVMRAMADGKEWLYPATIEDESVLKEIEKDINELGYPKNKN